MSEALLYLDPRSIIVTRNSRQRQENITDIEDLKLSIGRIGYIHPPVIRNAAEGGYQLVVGERRLLAGIALGKELVPFRLFENLSPAEAEVIELEENLKRKELTWRDQVRATGRLHALYKEKVPGWNVEKTAEELSMHHSYLRRILFVYDALDGGRIARAESIDQAFNTLHRFAERAAEQIVSNLIVTGAQAFGAPPAQAPVEELTLVDALATISENTVDSSSMLDEEPSSNGTLGPRLLPEPNVQILPIRIDPSPGPVLCANFIEWAKTYSGPKFTLVHCDFPYGNYRGGDSQGSLSTLETEEFYDNVESVYWNLLDALTTNIDRIMSYSSHLMFWFNMNFYTETVARLRKVGLMVHDHPLIWHKTGGPGGQGVVPGTAVTYPRRMYDTALMCVRGNRPMARPGANSYSAPTVGNKIHPSQKNEAMLSFFLRMFVDETTLMLDPTCGSGSALRAAENIGAKSILGLEMDPNYAASANTYIMRARILRQAGTLVKEGNGQ